MLDIIYLTKNRLEFTKASFETLLKNTDWSLVQRLLIFDDESTDGTRNYLLKKFIEFPLPYGVRMGFYDNQKYGSPAAVTLAYIQKHDPEPLFVKLDNDVIVPPEWLNRVHAVMLTHPELHFLGIEPPNSRVPHFENRGTRSLQPENDPQYSTQCFAPCNSIGGIGAMRTEVFLKYSADLLPHSIYGGFTEWQLKHREINKGWINPPLDVFLLDRMPVEPWLSLSARYIREGNQRQWSRYPLDNPYWRWWSQPNV